MCKAAIMSTVSEKKKLRKTQKPKVSKTSPKSTFDEAIDIWIKLETGVYSDESYPGLHCLAHFLSSLDSEQIIFKYMDFVLERDQKLGAKILINRKLSENISTAEKLVRHLHKYPEAEQIYLENLIFKMKIRVNFQFI